MKIETIVTDHAVTQCVVCVCPICHHDVKIPMPTEFIDWKSVYYEERTAYLKLIDSMKTNIMHMEKIIKEEK